MKTMDTNTLRLALTLFAIGVFALGLTIGFFAGYLAAVQ